MLGHGKAAILSKIFFLLHQDSNQVVASDYVDARGLDENKGVL